jgi:hypothetical protein
MSLYERAFMRGMAMPLPSLPRYRSAQTLWEGQQDSPS